METTAHTSVTEKIINGLRRAATELEEFRVQLTLGKADARDKYEETKKKFSYYLHEVNLRLHNTKEFTREQSTKLKILLEEVQVILALGRAETRDAFEEQRKKLNALLNRISNYIHTHETANEIYTGMLHEIEKFRIKIDILRLRYKLDSFHTRAELKKRRQEFAERLEKARKNLDGRKNNRWGHFRTELTEAYTHLKKALARP